MDQNNQRSRVQGLACGGLDVTYRDVGALKPNPRNPRTHSKKQIRQIARSIRTFGLNNPVLINADTEYSGDESFHFRQILEFLDGRLFFYYDGISYSGILEGLSAIPFIWIFGENSMAFKLSAIMFYGLFIWSSYLLARLFQPSAAWIWVVLLLFPSAMVVNHIIAFNYSNALTFFLINLALINFFKYKTLLNKLKK